MSKKILFLFIFGISVGWVLGFLTDEKPQEMSLKKTKPATRKITAAPQDPILLASQIEEMKKSYPESKDELIAVIIEKASTHHHDPHSIEAMNQRKKGAIKVLALRTLISAEKSKENQIRFLVEIIDRANDPTMIKIAKAYKSSLEKGRSFIDDFNVAISSLPIPE